MSDREFYIKGTGWVTWEEAHTLGFTRLKPAMLKVYTEDLKAKQIIQCKDQEDYDKIYDSENHTWVDDLSSLNLIRQIGEVDLYTGSDSRKYLCYSTSVTEDVPTHIKINNSVVKYDELYSSKGITSYQCQDYYVENGTLYVWFDYTKSKYWDDRSGKKYWTAIKPEIGSAVAPNDVYIPSNTSTFVEWPNFDLSQVPTRYRVSQFKQQDDYLDDLSELLTGYIPYENFEIATEEAFYPDTKYIDSTLYIQPEEGAENHEGTLLEHGDPLSGDYVYIWTESDKDVDFWKGEDHYVFGKTHDELHPATDDDKEGYYWCSSEYLNYDQLFNAGYTLTPSTIVEIWDSHLAGKYTWEDDQWLYFTSNKRTVNLVSYQKLLGDEENFYSSSGSIASISLPYDESYYITNITFDSLRYYTVGEISHIYSINSYKVATVTWTDSSLGDLSDKIRISHDSSSPVDQDIFRIIFITESSISGYHPSDTSETNSNCILDYSYSNGTHSITFSCTYSDWTETPQSGRIQLRYLDGVTTFETLSSNNLIYSSGMNMNIAKDMQSDRYDMYSAWGGDITVSISGIKADDKPTYAYAKVVGASLSYTSSGYTYTDKIMNIKAKEAGSEGNKLSVSITWHDSWSGTAGYYITIYKDGKLVHNLGRFIDAESATSANDYVEFDGPVPTLSLSAGQSITFYLSGGFDSSSRVYELFYQDGSAVPITDYIRYRITKLLKYSHTGNLYSSTSLLESTLDDDASNYSFALTSNYNVGLVYFGDTPIDNIAGIQFNFDYSGDDLISQDQIIGITSKCDTSTTVLKSRFFWFYNVASSSATNWWTPSSYASATPPYTSDTLLVVGNSKYESVYLLMDTGSVVDMNGKNFRLAVYKSLPEFYMDDYGYSGGIGVIVSYTSGEIYNLPSDLYTISNGNITWNISHACYKLFKGHKFIEA